MVKQISVFIENSTGRLADVSRIVANAGINLRAISIADTADFGILRMITDNPDKTLDALQKAGFTAKETEVIGVEVQDNPGGLAQVMEIFERDGANIEYLYASLERTEDKAVVIFKIENLEHGISVLKKNKINIVESF